jgi:light-regulated signal transduction histidine kinase (bacteriophytochrome)
LAEGLTAIRADEKHRFSMRTAAAFSKQGQRGGATSAQSAEATPMSEAMAAMSDELASRVLALAEANRELESFSYTVSHDLRTPLTVIENYVYLLRRSGGDDLRPESKKALDGIHGAVQRMALIIQNILYMSRVTRMPLSRKRVDIATIARQALAELAEREPRRKVKVTAPDHLWAMADAAILRIAMANLLANAWKFSSKRADARITIGRVPRRSPPTYFVKDNGVGFDMANGGRLFQLFQRLHATDFEGTGIGLATVARAIERHDGTVWADSRPGKGATFFFTLGDQSSPLSPPHGGKA